MTTGPDDAPAPGARSDPLTRVADLVSVASDFGAIWVLATGVELVRRRHPWRSVGRLGAAGVVSLALTRLLKHYFAAPRPAATPETGGLARTPSSPGFPSGHTLAAFTAALVLPSTSRGRAAALGFATLVAWARVRVGHHRPLDVVAGAGAGLVAGGAVRAVLSVV